MPVKIKHRIFDGRLAPRPTSCRNYIGTTAAERLQMHLTPFRRIVRDAEVANAISPIVRSHKLSE